MKSRGMVIYIFISKILIHSLLSHLAESYKTAWVARNKRYGSHILSSLLIFREIFQIFLTI